MNAKEALKVAGIALDGLDFIEGWLGLGKPAEEIITAVKAAVSAIREGVEGKTSPQIVLAQIEELHQRLTANDAAADAELAARFPAPGGSSER